MKGKFKLGSAVLGIILAASFWLPSLPMVHAKSLDWERLKDQLKKASEFKELKLSPEKERALLQVEEKYSQERKGIIGALKKNQKELQTALAAPTRDEAKIKELVGNMNAAQEK